jgi:hypothetical protein
MLVAAELVGFGATVSLGIVAVALSLGIVLALAWPIRLLWLQKIGGVSLKQYFRPYPHLVAATAVMAGAVWVAGELVGNAHAVPELVIKICVGLVVYAMGLTLFAHQEAVAILVWLRNRRNAGVL